MSDPPPSYQVHVLRWMREEQGLVVDEIETISPYGTEWAGDTEGGFFSQFSVSIRYRSDDELRWLECDGETMASLWDYVVRQLPAE